MSTPAMVLMAEWLRDEFTSFAEYDILVIWQGQRGVPQLALLRLFPLLELKKNKGLYADSLQVGAQRATAASNE